ncbi:GNAT family N-acetyltransferase [Vibrio metoecus]|uniref:GNAT family N-acetyltransferase n=1 Tax=Vibrio metoecus TaxID=1481663 RepID=UPI00215C4541|nr:GNAT family N-acetyltransferase [Vibrio metoecus]MCR9388144.1 GNAT family N-acetyltransferase [Vibrio metoecus]
MIGVNEVLLEEVSKEKFAKKVNFVGFTNSERLEFLKFKYYFIQKGGDYLGYVVLAETYNKHTKQKHWILTNINVSSAYRRRGIGSSALKATHNILFSQLGAKSYVVTISNYEMFKMIVREYVNGDIDFYCLVNNLYPVDEMKEEEKILEQHFMQNPHCHADMIVSFDKYETERVKPLFFKV